MSAPGPLPTAFGRYQVLEELGAGAMGIVYLCVDPRLNRPVAIKVMRESEFMATAEREQYEARFRHEAEAAGRLTHPDIVQVYDVGPSWMVMEFLEGQALNAFLKRGQRLSVRQVLRLVARVADAVDYAHRHGIVHRDIKPANVMLLEDGGVKVMDFGVARLEHSTLTAFGTVVGSVRYMAPEQMMGERVDGRADIFSVAAVAYELLTGQAPFPGKTITEVVSRVVHGTHVPPQTADHRLPEGLNAVFARAFAPRPGDRFARAIDFARELETAAEPALDLQVEPGFDAHHAGRTEVPAPTAGPALTVPSSPAAPLGETVFLGEGREQGQLVLDVEPTGVAAEINGRRVEDPLAPLTLSFGVHSLRLTKDGHGDVACHFELHATHPHLRLSAVLPKERPRAPEAPPAADDDVVPPRRIAGALPVLPDGQGIHGTAAVDVYVGKAGEVLRVEEVFGDSRLMRALEETVKGWRFEPAERAGAKVAARLRVQHVFAT